MKTIRNLTLLVIVLCTLNTNAQTGIDFGFRAGLNIATQYGIKPADMPYTVDSEPRYGFTGGLILHFPITDAFSVQQEFIFSCKGSGQSISTSQPAMSTKTEYEINYFELPILFKYNFANIGPVKIYGSSGFALSVLINGDYSVDGTIDMGTMIAPLEESGKVDGLDEFDYSFIYGVGASFDLFGQSVFFDYRQTIGWNTLMMPTYGDGAPAELRNQCYTLTLGIFL